MYNGWHWRNGIIACCAVLASLTVFPASAQKQEENMLDIGSRLELFVDDWLIDRMKGVELRLQQPVPRDVSLTFDQPWEGNTSTYVTVFADDGLFRMYYRGSHHDWKTKGKGGHSVVCYAESRDGIHWARPVLNQLEFQGSRANNIVWTGVGNHNFTPFRDTHPACRPAARYKALGSGKGGLFAFQSADALTWSLMRETPVITKGAFDSQNLAFWDAVRGRYVDFHRGFTQGVRHIMTCTSPDFLQWTEPAFVDFGAMPPEHLYTNATIAYHRAPHIFLAFPMRFMEQRKKVADHPNTGVSDGVFMSSRDGVHWRRWGEGFIRPGPQTERWWQRNNMPAWGILVTPSGLPGTPDELSLYTTENYYATTGHCRLRRHSLRQDGFVSVHAPYAGGEFISKPLIFAGKELVLNASTSAAGSVRVEILTADGRPMPGFDLASCSPFFGDAIETVVSWKDGADVSPLAGQPVRLRFVLTDADLYSLRFRP